MSEHEGIQDGPAAVEADQELARQYRDDWFTRQLGEGWVAAGDGIYYPPGAAPPRPQVEPVEALDDALRSSLPREARGEAAEEQADHPRRGRWLRRHSGSPH